MQRRPIPSEEMIQAAAVEVADGIGGGANADDIVREYRHPMDGFELAMELVKWCSWDLNREDMDALDEMEAIVRAKHASACRQWFEDNDIQPPFPVGTEIEEGVIEGVSEHHVATYMVREPKTPVDEKRWRLIKFEDARLPASSRQGFLDSSQRQLAQQ